MEILESAGPILGGRHLGVGRDAEVPGDERVFVHLAAKDQGKLDRAAHQLIPFEFCLSAGRVDDAINWRFGEVLVWAKNASLNDASVVSQQSSFTMMSEP